MSVGSLDLNLLQSFQVIAEVGSISGASRFLHLTQPALSMQIRKLEDQVGGRLFDRENRGLRLTALGKAVLARAHVLSAEVKSLHAAIHEFRDEPSGVVNVGTYTTASSHLLAPRLGEFYRLYPKVTVRYCYDPSEQILDKIVDNELECAVLSEVPKDPRFDLEPLYRDELILAAGPDHPFAEKIRPKDLADADFLSYPLRFDLCYQAVEREFGRHLAKARVLLETTSFDTLKQTLLSGAGVTFIPRYLVKEELDRGLLREIQITGMRLPIQFYVVTKKGGVLSKAARLWIEAVLKWR